jgi:hypothetical protein
MDGVFPSSQHREVIRSWMAAITRDGGISRYDDLHIDRIDRAWKSREQWIPAALSSYEVAVEIRDEQKCDLSVVLAFSLQSGEYPGRLVPHSLSELEASLHATPPSLYLFRPGTEFWTQEAEQMTVQDIDCASLFGARINVNRINIKRCIHMEFRRPSSGEHVRSLFVAG